MPTSEIHEPIKLLGAVVLCGGKSTRLGIDKNQLIFQGQTFLERVVRQVRKVCRPVVLVGNTDFALHKLPTDVEIAGDERMGNGPLEGIRVGLQRLSEQVEYAFVTSCDVPLLQPELIRFLFSQVGQQQAVVPVQRDRVFGMTAIYQTELHEAIGRRIAQNQLRVSELATAFNANRIDIESLRAIDSNLDSLTNVNSASDYFELLKRFGLECPEEFKGRLSYPAD